MPADPERESGHIARRLALLAQQYDRGALAPAPDVSGLSWACLRPAYAAEIGYLARDQ